MYAVIDGEEVRVDSHARDFVRIGGVRHEIDDLDDFLASRTYMPPQSLLTQYLQELVGEEELAAKMKGPTAAGSAKPPSGGAEKPPSGGAEQAPRTPRPGPRCCRRPARRRTAWACVSTLARNR